MSQVQIFTGFERFWHWSQTILIFGMLLTGFEIHGTYSLFGFEQALDYHLILAWTLIGLWAFAIFWHFTTGEWRQYVPTHKELFAMMLYYGYGIFSGEAKPYRTTRGAKHNPLQRLAYLGFKVAIAPALWISGLLLLFYASWSSTALGAVLPLQWVAWVHMGAVFALLLFLIAHIYLAATTGHPWYAYLKAMVTGNEELEDTQ
ncbi:MAG: cytochrome b/b6 domain-containing protein [Pseudomonadota bacterium]|nr:cytochrome b/b6 domain-containing protein [Pseudomonadota bacterium]